MLYEVSAWRTATQLFLSLALTAQVNDAAEITQSASAATSWVAGTNNDRAHSNVVISRSRYARYSHELTLSHNSCIARALTHTIAAIK